MSFCKTDIEKLELAITPLATAEGVEIIDIEFINLGSILRIYIDKQAGVTIDDCASFSRTVSDVINVEFPETEGFHLEISSPGLERVIKKERDFIKYTGRKIKLKTFAPLEGQKKFTGIIVGYKNDKLLLGMEHTTVEIEKKNIAKANLVFEGDI